jgi:hypothetical protein
MSDVQLSETELSIIREFEKARHLADLVRHPGWAVYLDLRNHRINQIKEQFMRGKYDKDTLWAMQVRLSGIQEFAEAWHEGVVNAVESLEPESVQRILDGVTVNPADLDGDLV